MTLRFRLHRFDSHMRRHTIQIDKTWERVDYPPSEAKRLIRLIYVALAQVEGTLIEAPEIGDEVRRDLARRLESRCDEIAGTLA